MRAGDWTANSESRRSIILPRLPSGRDSPGPYRKTPKRRERVRSYPFCTPPASPIAYSRTGRVVRVWSRDGAPLHPRPRGPLHEAWVGQF
jgi:hypothetical protein